MHSLKQFESVSNAPQRENLQLHMTQSLLKGMRTDIGDDCLAHIDPKYADKSGYSLNFHLEHGIIKLQRNNEESLTAVEREAVTIFRMKSAAPA